MKRRTKTILLYSIVALLTVAFLQFGFFISTNFLSRWYKPSMSNSNTFHARLDIKQQLENTTQTPTTKPPANFTAHSILQIKHKTSLTTKRSCAQHYDLLILVSSAPANLKRRNNIRRTWAFEKAFKPRWTTAFLVAKTRTEALSNALLKEDKAYGDLVRANYYDHYWNQTRKIQMGFEWAITYCKFSFLFKVDDDVFANPAVALSFLKEPTTPREKLYAGYHYRNPTVHRSGKWAISHEEFSGTHFPDFCFGFGYILSHDVVGLFVETLPSLPFFRLDDVYVGMLGSKTGIKITHNKGFELDTPKEWKCIPKTSTFVRHNVEGNCQLLMFNRASNFSSS